VGEFLVGTEFLRRPGAGGEHPSRPFAIDLEPASGPKKFWDETLFGPVGSAKNHFTGYPVYQELTIRRASEPCGSSLRLSRGTTGCSSRLIRCRAIARS